MKQNHTGNTTYGFSFIERDPDWILVPQPTTMTRQVKNPTRVFNTVSDYNENYNSNFHQEKTSGPELLLATNREMQRY